MSPSSQAAGDFFDIIGRLRRSANTSSRYGQVDELMRLADELVRWQARLRTEICKALGVNPPTSVSIEAMIVRIQNEHARAEEVPEAVLRAYRAARAEESWSSPTADALNGVIRP